VVVSWWELVGRDCIGYVTRVRHFSGSNIYTARVYRVVVGRPLLVLDGMGGRRRRR